MPAGGCLFRTRGGRCGSQMGGNHRADLVPEVIKPVPGFLRHQPAVFHDTSVGSGGNLAADHHLLFRWMDTFASRVHPHDEELVAPEVVQRILLGGTSRRHCANVERDL